MAQLVEGFQYSLNRKLGVILSSIAVMGKTPKKRFKGSDTKAADVAPLIQKYIKKAVTIEYRETQQGAMCRGTLTEWLMFFDAAPSLSLIHI